MISSLRYRLLFLALVLLLGLGLLNPILAVTYLIDPITRIAWLVIRTFLMIDQKVYWVLLIFAVFTFFLRILPACQESPRRPAYNDTARPEDRVAYWEALLRSAKGNKDSRSTLQQELTGLNRSIEGLVDGVDPLIVDLPPVSGVIKHRLLTVLRAPGRQRDTVLENYVASILKSGENNLEINND